MQAGVLGAEPLGLRLCVPPGGTGGSVGVGGVAVGGLGLAAGGGRRGGRGAELCHFATQAVQPIALLQPHRRRGGGAGAHGVAIPAPDRPGARHQDLPGE